MTFSIVARQGEAYGVAVASKFLAVGAVVPAARTAWVRSRRSRLPASPTSRSCSGGSRPGRPPTPRSPRRPRSTTAARRARSASSGWAAPRPSRGPECNAWAGGVARDDGDTAYAIQGNILTGPEVVASMERAWHASSGQAAGPAPAGRARRGRRRRRRLAGAPERRDVCRRAGCGLRRQRGARRPARRRPRRPRGRARPAPVRVGDVLRQARGRAAARGRARRGGALAPRHRGVCRRRPRASPWPTGPATPTTRRG